MKKKLLRTKTSKRNAKRTNAHPVSLSRWLGGNIVIKKDVLSATQNAINSLQFIVFNGTKDTPKEKCSETIIELQKYLAKVTEFIKVNDQQ